MNMHINAQSFIHYLTMLPQTSQYNVVLYSSTGEKINTLPIAYLKEQIKNLILSTDFISEDILNSQLINFQAHSYTNKLKNRKEIPLFFHDRRTNTNIPFINANKDNTNFIYKVEGVTHDQTEKCNEIKRFKEKFEYLQSVGASVSFFKTANNTLHNNLTLLDLGIERIIAESLLLYYSGFGKDVEQIISKISLDDPLHIATDTCQPMYAYKMKQFLIAFALGMTASKPWCGKFNANGGYIVVKEDGDIVCYHFFDRNDLEDYLYHNTRFETPSTTRHEFGDIWEKEGCFYMKLNLQIRFK